VTAGRAYTGTAQRARHSGPSTAGPVQRAPCRGPGAEGPAQRAAHAFSRNQREEEADDVLASTRACTGELVRLEFVRRVHGQGTSARKKPMKFSCSSGVSSATIPASTSVSSGLCVRARARARGRVCVCVCARARVWACSTGRAGTRVLGPEGQVHHERLRNEGVGATGGARQGGRGRMQARPVAPTRMQAPGAASRNYTAPIPGTQAATGGVRVPPPAGGGPGAYMLTAQSVYVRSARTV
jgi:hypothetical protein